MRATIEGNPAFGHVHIDLDPGDCMVAESGAMQSMSANLEMKTEANGGFFSALAKRLFGGESFFVNRFTNPQQVTQRVTIAQDVPGEIVEMRVMEGKDLCLQKGAYLAHAGDIKLKTVWAGFISMLVGEGLIKLKVSGNGVVWFGAYGGIVAREVEGDLKVDDGHLVAYEPSLKMKMALAGGLMSSVFGGEGIVTRMEGTGRVYIQTRSLKGLATWLNPKFQ